MNQNRRKMLQLFSALLLTAVWSTNAASEQSITPHTAEYKVSVSILSGKLKTQLTETNEGYSARSVLRAAGFARMFVRGDVVDESTFTITDDGVKPLYFNSADKVSKKDKFISYRFDWDQHQATGTINEEDVTFDLDGRVHDRVSIQYELMLDLINDRASDKYAVLDDELKMLAISKVDTKDIKVPFGTFKAVGIQHRKIRKNKKKSDRITTLWCAEELGFLPVLIEQHRDGKLAMRAVLTKYVPTTAVANTN